MPRETRPLEAGTIIGSGTVSNRLDGGPATGRRRRRRLSCIAEMRSSRPSSRHGEDAVPAVGDTIRIEMKDSDGHSIFGAIEQSVQRP